MREKYNVFRIGKINKTTIEIALQLKKEMEKPESFNEKFIFAQLNAVPVEKEEFLEHFSFKYLNLKPADGIPLLKKAYKKQYSVEDEYKKCRQCGKVFNFDRRSKAFCSNRCRQRCYRNKRAG